MNTKEEERELKDLILRILEDNYSCANEIIQKLKEDELAFEVNKFYPTLTNLQLKNLLCTNWIKNQNGEPIKYYHITKNGFSYIHNNNNQNY